MPHKPHPYPVKYIENPSQKDLRDLALKHTPAALVTAYGSINKVSYNKARMAQYTYIIAKEEDKAKYSGNIIDPEKAKGLIQRQKEHILKMDTLIQIDGYYGLGKKAYPVQWLYTQDAANVAGMQQILSFPREKIESPEDLKKPFQPAMRLFFTPYFFPEDMPGKLCIIADIDNFISYVMGSDYFGESKKGMLRMLNEYVYRQGGLVLHAGAKVVKIGSKRVTMTIKGLSGTGKTTTTFSKQGTLAQPVQDDMVCLWSSGAISITENGCFAKTFGLTIETEPAIYEGSIDPSAWTENVYMNKDGTFDFSKEGLTPEEVARWRDVLIATKANPENVDAYISGKAKYADVVDANNIPKDGWDFVVWSQNGRSIIPLKAIKDAADLTDIPPVKSMGILNRDEGAEAGMPGIVLFASPEQAAGYFMLGETSKTSAAGKERGKTRSPFTQPFFPQAHRLQAKRFSELAATIEGLSMWLMNTGYVGGDAKAEKAGKALKVKIRHSSAMLEAMLTDQIKWKKDPDFHYYVVDVDAPENKELLKKVPAEILNPSLFFKKQGRTAEYEQWVKNLKSERKAFLEKFKVDPEIIEAVNA